jgi:hypothetical protein
MCDISCYPQYLRGCYHSDKDLFCHNLAIFLRENPRYVKFQLLPRVQEMLPQIARHFFRDFERECQYLQKKKEYWDGIFSEIGV